MSETPENGAPIVFATQPPTATARDDDIFLTVTAAARTVPDRVETIDIFLSVDYARQAIAQLREAVDLATKGDACQTPVQRQSSGSAVVNVTRRPG